MAHVAPKAGSDLLEHDLWLRGQAHFSHEPPGWRKASELYREIVAQHPRVLRRLTRAWPSSNTVHFVHPGVFRARMQRVKRSP